MKITSISYTRLVSLGNDENEKIGATATVLEDESPMQALIDLQEWVNKETVDLRDAESRCEAAQGRLYGLESRERAIQGRIDRAADKWAQVVAWMDKHGINVGRYITDDIPF